MIELRIPAAGDAVAEVQLVEWTVDDGAAVQEGDVIYTIESDKSVIEVPSPATGKLEILVAAGEIFKVGHLIGRIG